MTVPPIDAKSDVHVADSCNCSTSCCFRPKRRCDHKTNLVAAAVLSDSDSLSSDEISPDDEKSIPSIAKKV